MDVWVSFVEKSIFCIEVTILNYSRLVEAYGTGGKLQQFDASVIIRHNT